VPTSFSTSTSHGRYRGPLHGVPLALKDVIATRNVRTTNGSKIFADSVPDHDAAVTERLRSAGAVLVGKNNMHELAMGSRAPALKGQKGSVTMLTATETAAVSAVDGEGAVALLGDLVRAQSVWPKDMEEDAEITEVIRCTKVLAVSALRACGAAR